LYHWTVVWRPFSSKDDPDGKSDEGTAVVVDFADFPAVLVLFFAAEAVVWAAVDAAFLGVEVLLDFRVEPEVLVQGMAECVKKSNKRWSN
jgi:hypothetical protein